MENNTHNNENLHWSYGAANVPNAQQIQWISPAQSNRLKRAMSESDCEELYSEESSKEQVSPSEPGSCQLMSRKKRRGVIEKKRRDRINSSLSELKRLVPSAYEKQGSAKLEKAEILQLTVEYLKNLHSKGMDSFSYDPQRFAMDYHVIGFRECAAEVARYLVTIEGMDIQDPLRLRLMSHLQYFVQQRELTAKSCPSASNWSAANTPSPYPSNCAVSPYQSYVNGSATQTASATSYIGNLPTHIQHAYPTLNSPNSTNIHSQQQTTSMHIVPPNTVSTNPTSEPTSIMNHNTAQQARPQPQSSQTQTSQQSQPTSSQDSHHSQQRYSQESAPHQDHQSSTFIELTNAQILSSSHRNTTPTAIATTSPYNDAAAAYAASGEQTYHTNSDNLNYVSTNNSKPYRPWGAEMAY